MEYKKELIENKMVVYAIANKINGKKYIGITTNSFAERYPHGIRAHHNPHLRNSVKKYGQANFEVILLEKNVKDMETLCKLEMKYIEKYDTCNADKGYNKSLGGLGVRQTERSEEHCRNISIAKKKIGLNTLTRMTPEAIKKRNAKISKAMSGKNNPMWNGGTSRNYLRNKMTEEEYQKMLENRRQSMMGENNHRYGITKSKMKPETLEKLRQASLGKNNPMYGKNIKDYMTEEAYEQWKKNVANPGAKNGMARKTVIVYKGKKYEFDYAQEGIDYFKNKGEHITRYWFYNGVTEKYKNKFQFVGYIEDYEEYIKALVK